MKLNRFCFVCVAFFLLVGCSRNPGPPLTKVGGVVTRSGAPLADAQIEFRKVDTGALSFATTDAQGRFTLRHTHGRMGAEPGRYRVKAILPGKELPTPPGWQPAEEGEGPPRGPEVELTSAGEGPVEVEITEAGPNEFEIDFK